MSIATFHKSIKHRPMPKRFDNSAHPKPLKKTKKLIIRIGRNVPLEETKFFSYVESQIQVGAK